MDKDEVCEEDIERTDQSSVAAEQADVDSAASDGAGASDAESKEAIQGDDSLGKLEARIAELEEENSELKDKYLRKHADFENFRKRMLREKEDFAKYANQQILSDLVSVIDDFERAISSSVGSNDFQSFHDGIVMIEKQLVSMLENRYHLTRFDDQGQDFDPQRHEAVASAPAEEGQESAKVEEVFQKGYLLHDRVIRSAKVKVSMP